jgi:hypothetical protein
VERLIKSKIRTYGTRARARAPARPRERERAIRAVEQNDYGKIGSLFRRASPLIEHEHDDEHEHDCPNFGIWIKSFLAPKAFGASKTPSVYAALLSAALSLASSSLESEVFSTRGL